MQIDLFNGGGCHCCCCTVLMLREHFNANIEMPLIAVPGYPESNHIISVHVSFYIF